MTSDENKDASKSMSIFAKLFVGTSALFGAGAGATLSTLSEVAVIATAVLYRIEIPERHPRRFIPSFIPRGVFLGGMVGGAVGYSATVVFGKGYSLVKNAVSPAPVQKDMNTEQVQSKPFK